MSHALRAAVAALSLFTCPACVTTGSLLQTAAERTEAAHVAGALPPPPSPGATVLAGVAPTAPAPEFVPVANNASLPLWDQVRPTGSGVNSVLTIEPADSRLRLVLNLLNPGWAAAAEVDGIGAVGFGAASPDVAALAASAVLLAPGGTGWPEPLPAQPQLALLGSPLGVEAPAPPVVPTHTTPEPGTLALAGLGVCALGVRRLRVSGERVAHGPR